MRITFDLNDTQRAVDIEPGEVLYDVLKRLGISSVKKGCGTSSCGICTVLLDGKPVPSCSYLAVKADGRNITTIEGLSHEAEKLGAFMNEEGAIQCGYCTPGFIITTIAMKKELTDPSENDIRNYLQGNLCRCTGYEGQLRAVKKYLEVSE